MRSRIMFGAVRVRVCVPENWVETRCVRVVSERARARSRTQTVGRKQQFPLICIEIGMCDQ